MEKNVLIHIRRSLSQLIIELVSSGLRRPFSIKLCHRMLLRAFRKKCKDHPFEMPEYRFLARIVLDGHRSRAQLFQDLWVLYELNDKREGFFVEFGAADGVYLSNTWLLEKEYGWRGILAEPVPYWHEALHRNRSAIISTACVAGHTGLKVSLYIPKTSAEYATICQNFKSSIHSDHFTTYEQIEVETISLIDLLQKYKAPQEIDYISIDVEGSELEILENFDFNKYKVYLWTIEHNNDIDRKAAIDKLMTAHGYELCFQEFSLFDAWYRLKNEEL